MRSYKFPSAAPVNDQEFVLLNGDSLEMHGLLAHLKLPHYVAFQSMLDQKKRSGFWITLLEKESEVAYGKMYHIVLTITSYEVRDNGIYSSEL